MSSGFVSGGTVDNPVERDDEWRAAQQELAEKRRQKEDEGVQEGGKSLYEVLQANKAAKQDAFEEANRLKNQFRALDDSEAEFLDSVLESTRRQEESIRKDTLEQLDLFRKHQEEAERKVLTEQNAGSPPPTEGAPQWNLNRKRKKGNDKDGGLLRGVKLKKSNLGNAQAEHPEGRDAKEDKTSGKAAKPSLSKEMINPEAKVDSKTAQSRVTAPSAGSASSPAGSKNTVSLGLGYASSDEDD